MNLRDFSQVIHKSKKIVFFSGAGISTDSGLPDFRSPGGIWAKYKTVYYQDFIRDESARVYYWKMKRELYDLYKKALPNDNHRAIKTFYDQGKLKGIITQNIDGFHSMVGIPHDFVVELHGTDRKIQCLSCLKEYDLEEIFDTIQGDFTAPRCFKCNGYLKVATISFGQAMPEEPMRLAHEWSKSGDLFITLGSSLQVEPAATFPVIAKNHQAYLAIVNKESTQHDMLADFVYRGEIKDFFKGILCVDSFSE